MCLGVRKSEFNKGLPSLSMNFAQAHLAKVAKPFHQFAQAHLANTWPRLAKPFQELCPHLPKVARPRHRPANTCPSHRAFPRTSPGTRWNLRPELGEGPNRSDLG